MAKTPNGPLSASQYEIMCVVWEMGEAGVNDVLHAINAARRKKLKRTTIQVQMSRLEKKGWLEHERVGRSFYYRALRDRDETQAYMAKDLTNRVFGGSCAELVKCLFNSRKPTGKELKRLRKVLDEAKGG